MRHVNSTLPQDSSERSILHTTSTHTSMRHEQYPTSKQLWNEAFTAHYLRGAFKWGIYSTLPHKQHWNEAFAGQKPQHMLEWGLYRTQPKKSFQVRCLKHTTARQWLSNRYLPSNPDTIFQVKILYVQVQSFWIQRKFRCDMNHRASSVTANKYIIFHIFFRNLLHRQWGFLIHAIYLQLQEKSVFKLTKQLSLKNLFHYHWLKRTSENYTSKYVLLRGEVNWSQIITTTLFKIHQQNKDVRLGLQQHEM